LKPSNILINFEGTLRIGDFGCATSMPAEKPETEGDREYLAPEVLRSEFGKPADVFSLGLIMLEMAANVTLPPNGATWHALRNEDFSEVPVLTQESNAVLRDATGMPMDETDRSVPLLGDANATSRPTRRTYNFRHANRQSGDIFGLARKNELQHPPEFMKEPTHPSSLDVVVKSMLSNEPLFRPTVSQLIELPAIQWVASRQRAGATVFEGNWGPGDEALEPISLDTEMTDV
jgi:mitosis inhibitor protein kinase SWE1